MIHELTANELTEAVHSKTLSVSEIVTAHLERIEAVNPAVNAICTINPEAPAAAAASDRRIAAGETVRALEGVPFVVKDVIETRDVRTTFGSLIMADFVPSEDAVVVERLKSAGAILLGKANTPEFAADITTTNAIFGITRNPWNLNASSGGSSGGTGAAVAAGMAPLGVGTDLGGSIRTPAAFNGIVGLRPAPGRVPQYPQEFGWDTLVPHVTGPMCRTVDEVGQMLAVMAGPDDRDPSTLPAPEHDYVRAASGQQSLNGRRIAFAGDLGGRVPTDPEVLASAEQAGRRFEALGCVVEEACFDLSDLTEIIAGTRAFAMVARQADRLEAHRDVMTANLIRQATGALEYDLRSVTRAERLRTGYWHRLREFMQKYDYIITPTLGVPAFRLDQPMPSEVGGVAVERFSDVLLSTYAFSITGLPVLAVPSGWNQAGLPLSFQIVGHRQREDLVLEAASAYAAAHPECFAIPRVDVNQARPVHADFTVNYSGFVSSATRL